MVFLVALNDMGTLRMMSAHGGTVELIQPPIVVNDYLTVPPCADLFSIILLNVSIGRCESRRTKYLYGDCIALGFAH